MARTANHAGANRQNKRAISSTASTLPFFEADQPCLGNPGNVDTEVQHLVPFLGARAILARQTASHYSHLRILAETNPYCAVQSSVSNLKLCVVITAFPSDDVGVFFHRQPCLLPVSQTPQPGTRGRLQPTTTPVSRVQCPHGERRHEITSAST